MNVKISQKGWVVIPAAMRAKYALKPGDNMQVVDYGGVLAIVPAFENLVKQGMGLLKGDDSLAQAVIEEHRKERERESH
jgi:AbrB family looped-hinge helix DNA binding protein